MTINITVTDETVQPEIYLGRQGEKNYREIVFDLSILKDKYGSGTATLYHQRSKDPAPYLIGQTTGSTLTWTISETDTMYSGIGYAEFRYTFGTDNLSKTTMFATNVKESLAGDVIIPPAMQAWYDALIDYIDKHGGGGGGAVSSVNGKTGIVVLDADDVGAGTYSKPTGGIPATDMATAVQISLGKADTALQTAPVSSVNSRTGAVTGLQEQTTVATKTSSDTSQTLAENTFYIWPEMSALTITCPATGGPYAFRFTSGSTATTLTMTGITMPDDFAVEASKTYEINVYQGYGLAVSWEANA